MKPIEQSNELSPQIRWLTWLIAMLCSWPALGGDTASPAAAPNRPASAIHIVDQYGREVPSGKPDIGSGIFDVTVGPVENEFTFMPDTLNISVGDTVRWTWASDSHSVTSGTSCTS